MAKGTPARWLLWLVIGLLGGCAQPQAPLTGKALEQAAEQGDVHAQYLLARQLASQNEYPRAMQLMQAVGNKGVLSSATAEERSEAARQVGDWYQAGLGEPRSEPLALSWWEKASSLGNARASYQLAMRCQQQHGGEITTDCIDACETAGEQGDAGAQLALAKWFAGHEGASEKALSWLQKAADQQQPEALYLLAQRYEKGDGVDKRGDMAERLYLQSAEKGYPAAQRRQGELRTGKAAFDWYQKAAEGNEAAAQRWMAIALLEGKDTPRNEQQGMAWLQRAAIRRPSTSTAIGKPVRRSVNATLSSRPKGITAMLSTRWPGSISPVAKRRERGNSGLALRKRAIPRIVTPTRKCCDWARAVKRSSPRPLNSIGWRRCWAIIRLSTGWG